MKIAVLSDTRLPTSANYAGHGLGKQVLAAANGLVEPYDVRAGQRLLIPRQRAHRVREGETLLGIAHRNGVTLSQLAIANNLVEP